MTELQNVILNVFSVAASAVIMLICMMAARHSTRFTSIGITIAYVCIFGGAVKTIMDFIEGGLAAQASSVMIQIGVAGLLSISRRRAERGYPSGHMQPLERRRMSRRTDDLHAHIE